MLLPFVLRKLQRVVFYFSRFVRFTLFCTVASLKVPAMTVYDVATMVLGTELFPQLKITDLNSGITVIVMSSPEELLR